MAVMVVDGMPAIYIPPEDLEPKEKKTRGKSAMLRKVSARPQKKPDGAVPAKPEKVEPPPQEVNPTKPKVMTGMNFMKGRQKDI
jgi:hypothetical protein